MPAPSSVIAVILAAGGSTRFAAGPKQTAIFRDRPMVVHAARAAIDAGCFDEVVVVSGAVSLGDVLPDGVVEAINPRWAEGQATSLQVGIEHARAFGAAAVVVGLADQPMVGADAWRTVATEVDAVGTSIVVATYGGRRGNPVRLGSAIWDELPVIGDEGARGLMRLRPELVREVACAGDSQDIDTVEDLDRWN
jgi:molybdenum cofactor cytidylyltransferase